MTVLLVLPRPAKSLQASAEKLEYTGPVQKERVATEVAVGKNAGAALAKRKRNRAPDHKGGESQGGREPHLGKKEEDQSESMERKRWTPP